MASTKNLPSIDVHVSMAPAESRRGFLMTAKYPPAGSGRPALVRLVREVI